MWPTHCPHAPLPSPHWPGHTAGITVTRASGAVPSATTSSCTHLFPAPLHHMSHCRAPRVPCSRMPVGPSSAPRAGLLGKGQGTPVILSLAPGGCPLQARLLAPCPGWAAPLQLCWSPRGCAGTVLLLLPGDLTQGCVCGSGCHAPGSSGRAGGSLSSGCPDAGCPRAPSPCALPTRASGAPRALRHREDL